MDDITGWEAARCHGAGPADVFIPKTAFRTEKEETQQSPAVGGHPVIAEGSPGRQRESWPATVREGDGTAARLAAAGVSVRARGAGPGV